MEPWSPQVLGPDGSPGCLAPGATFNPHSYGLPTSYGSPWTRSSWRQRSVASPIANQHRVGTQKILAERRQMNKCKNMVKKTTRRGNLSGKWPGGSSSYSPVQEKCDKLDTFACSRRNNDCSQHRALNPSVSRHVMDQSQKPMYIWKELPRMNIFTFIP